MNVAGMRKGRRGIMGVSRARRPGKAEGGGFTCVWVRSGDLLLMRRDLCL